MQTTSSQIIISGLRIHARHGVDSQENIVGNDFELNILLEADTWHAMTSDSIDTTINYADVVDIAKREMLEVTSKLLENVVYRIYSALTRRYPQITGGEISLFKLAPPIETEVDKIGFCYRW